MSRSFRTMCEIEKLTLQLCSQSAQRLELHGFFVADRTPLVHYACARCALDI